MDEIKICPVCGSQVTPSRVGRIRIYCNHLCKKKAFRTKHADNERAYKKKYHLENKEKLQVKWKRESLMPWYKGKKSRSNNKAKELLTDSYISAGLFKSKIKDVPKQLIDLKRAQVQIARTLKELNDAPSKSNKRG